MKRFTKDGKTYKAPLIITDGGKQIITTDVKIAENYGYAVYIPPVYKPSLNTLIEDSNNNVNQETDNKILNEFIYKDNEFYLTMENQTNFANMFMARDYLEYPQKVKTKTGFIDLNTPEEVTEFYLAGVNFVKECLEEGWQRKAEAEAQIRADYENPDNA